MFDDRSKADPRHHAREPGRVGICVCPAPSTPAGVPAWVAAQAQPYQVADTVTAQQDTESIAHPAAFEMCSRRNQRRQQIDEGDVRIGHPENVRPVEHPGPNDGAVSAHSSVTIGRGAPRRRHRRDVDGVVILLVMTADSACTAATWVGWMTVLPCMPLARSS